MKGANTIAAPREFNPLGKGIECRLTPERMPRTMTRWTKPNDQQRQFMIRVVLLAVGRAATLARLRCQLAAGAVDIRIGTTRAPPTVIFVN